jgi:solute carrier family 25 folate transporter 32
MLAGAAAGLVSSVVTCPLDVVKTKLQAQGGADMGERAYRGLVGESRLPPASASSLELAIPGTCTRIWTEEGFKGFYRGLGPTIYGYLPTWAIVRPTPT